LELKQPSYGLKKTQGLNCKGFKRNWAKVKEKGLNRKGFASAGGFSAKKPGLAGVDLVDSG
jgi:hypothetical protein